MAKNMMAIYSQHSTSMSYDQLQDVWRHREIQNMRTDMIVTICRLSDEEKSRVQEKTAGSGDDSDSESDVFIFD